MMLKTLKVTVIALLFQMLMVGPALAQDLDSLVASALSANRQLVAQTNLALEAEDLATLQARTAAAVATGQQVESLLRSALALAPDDASRSRIEGVLTHIRAAIQSGQTALEATEFDPARAAVDAMRGEAEEALVELAQFAEQPVAPQAPAPAQLPEAGEVPSGGSAAVALALAGLLATLAGLRLRQKAA